MKELDKMDFEKMFEIHSAIIRSMASNRFLNYENDEFPEITRGRFNILHLVEVLEKAVVSDIVEIAQMSKSSVSLTLTRLEEDGYITRIPATGNDDKRKVYIVLTEKGKIASATVKKKALEDVKRFYGALNDREKNLYINMLNSAYELFVNNKEENK